MMGNSNFKDFNSIDDSNLNSVHELISTYGMEVMPQAMEILFNQAMRLERDQHLGAGHYQRSSDRLDYANGYKQKRVLVNWIYLFRRRETVIFIPTF
jgi:hypothetical protein